MARITDVRFVRRGIAGWAAVPHAGAMREGREDAGVGIDAARGVAVAVVFSALFWAAVGLVGCALAA